ncbi:MAG: hypothetical protein NTU53_14275, partial [Planctomycetota bacterium]|nr:hypothetical protein [Planctomycetota bacterium]
MPEQVSQDNTAHGPDLADIQLDREDIILLLLEANERLLGKPSLNGITRLEKLIFLLEQETEFEGVARFYVFKPYNFGPFSKEIYEAVEFLEGCELIQVSERPYPSYYANVGEAELLSEISENEIPSAEGEAEITATEKLFKLTGDGRKVSKLLRTATLERRPRDVEEL